MKAGDKLSEAVHTRRRKLGLSMRDVEARTAKLEEQDPTRFESVSRGTVSNIENGGREFFETRSRPLGQRRMNALIELLFNGDAERWLIETGYDTVPLTRDSVDMLRDRPLYEEGQEISAAAIRTGKGYLDMLPPELPWADLLLQVTTNHNSPVVHSGQIIGISLNNAVPNGSLALVSRAGVLELAWQVSEHHYRAGAGQPFGLAPRDTVLGRVAWVVPSLPQ